MSIHRRPYTEERREELNEKQRRQEQEESSEKDPSSMHPCKKKKHTSPRPNVVRQKREAIVMIGQGPNLSFDSSSTHAYKKKTHRSQSSGTVGDDSCCPRIPSWCA